VSALRVLERYARAGRGAPAGARCELCAMPLGDRHEHVVDLTARSLGCACRACAVLFRDGAAGGRYRTVPDRVLSEPEFRLEPEDLATLGVPVGLVFCFRNSRLDRWIAVYPSPAGPAEVELPATEWGRVTAASALVAGVLPDVEAILAHAARPGARPDWLLVPIDTCYQLVALVRQRWEGPSGGAGRAAVNAFINDLRSRARPITAKGARS
jgi:hypothetical protein